MSEIVQLAIKDACKLRALGGKCPNTEVFLARISCIRTKYGELLN